MAKAGELVRQCVCAGYRKIHLDPSIPCKDDVKNRRPHISLETIAERTALLCKTAENAAAAFSGKKSSLIYVVGAEVPVPGGMGAGRKDIRVSSAEDIKDILHTMHQAFIRNGLSDAWERCAAVVAETGATFDAETIYPYESTKTRGLQRFIEKRKNLVFEAHSTDFQSRTALTDMVRDHFAILKVGPCLTFAMREAFFALAAIERDFLGSRKAVSLSALDAVMKELMFRDQIHWRNHYQGGDERLQYLTVFGFSDRIRYYWSYPEARTAIDRLLANLTRYGIPLPLISQYLPDQLDAVRVGRIPAVPERLVSGKITKVLDTYAAACGEKII
jgi:D-tagatose-1,6-bisphosphate aldolase subunit GatZ/KbaZ